MAIGKSTRTCTIVLHDDPISTDDVLCGSNILSRNEVGFLVAPNAKNLCILPAKAAKNADEVSIHVSVARRFGLENRMKAKVQVLDDEDDAIATHVEVRFRDQHLTRADMWRMKAQANDTVVYQGKKLRYLGSTVAEVASVYIAGHEVDSAIIAHPRTKLIFRSYSARYTILIQLSKEMLQYWRDGDLMYERLLSGFLGDLFEHWKTLGVRHHMTVVLFGRHISAETSDEYQHGTDAPYGEPTQLRDFFHVVVSEMSSTEWPLLLRELRKAFQSTKLPHDVCLASNGNLVEAIYLTAMDFADDNLAPPASSTGTSIIAVTAGQGLFDANHSMLKRTTELLLGNSIGVDIVSLSPKPLHPVPLFQYEFDGITEYALPHWVDISYWPPNENSPSPWLLQECDNHVMTISLPPDERSVIKPKDDLASAIMSTFDEDVFEDLSDTLTQIPSHDTVVDTSITSNETVKTPSNHSTRPKAGVDTTDMQPNTHIKRASEHSNGEHRPASSSTASVPLTNRAKREGLPPHPLMQNFRKISLGPKGLAPSQGVASTTVSAHHVQQDRDMAAAPSAPSENPSLLARQIRESLNRKPSQKTLAFHQVAESSEASRPIAIRTSDDLPNNERLARTASDPASLIERAVLDGDSGQHSGSFSATPRGKRGSLALRGLSSFDTQDGSNTPWLTLLNPCNPKRETMRIASEYRKWQNVFPRAVSSSAFKWDSMCSPATLPLMTEVRVSMSDLEKHFTKKVRRILITPGSSASSERAQHVLHQLVALRLSAGFQIVPTRKLRKEQTARDHIDRIIVSLGSYYHELRYLSRAEVQVTEYERPEASQSDTENQSHLDDIYFAEVKPALSRKSRTAQVRLGFNPLSQDWSALDDQCANPSASADVEGVCKMRFALIPVQPSQSERTQLSDEEQRIDGIQRLTLMWQRHRYFAPEEQQHHASMARPKGVKAERDPNPLAIEYQTRDPSAVVGGLSSNTGDPTANKDANASLFSESEMYHTSNFDITKLVKHMQNPPPNGIEVKDRRWFTRLHFKCFRGDELCNWLLRVFKDIETREDAVALGNQLMDRDIFTHVRGKHEFRDGHYLYQIRGVHRTTEYPDTVGFFSRGIGKSVPSTPLVESMNSPSMRAAYGDSDSSGRGTPTPTSVPTSAHKEKRTILLTEKLRYNVDPNKRSDQLEIVDLHYDRIHNPENCYHIQLDWTNTTPKLVREAVARWASVVEGHGLKLIQLPMKETCRLHEQHPFDQTVSVSLAVRPPKKIPATPQLEPHNASPRAIFDNGGTFHKVLLRKLDFILDLEAAKSFPNTVDVSYSWGKPDFELTQYVHKSGLLLAQIANDGDADFLLLPNRLAPHPPATTKKADALGVADIASKFKAFCRDKEGLKAFYREVQRRSVVTPSPFSSAGLTADEDVPHMELPPHLMHRARS